MSRLEFIQKYYPVISTLGSKINVFPETVFAQAFVENTGKKGFGETNTFKNGNNVFNIKASKGWKGETIVEPGVKSESNIFRKYDSIEDSIKDYFSFLVNNSRYRNAGFFSAPNYQAQMDALQKAGYSTSSDYSALLKKVGATVRDTLNKLGVKLKQAASVVTSNPGSSVAIALGVGAALLLVLNSRNVRK